MIDLNQFETAAGVNRYITQLERELTVERKDAERLKARAEEAERELQIAINHCCNSYWNDGHGARVKERYGYDMEDDAAKEGEK